MAANAKNTTLAGSSADYIAYSVGIFIIVHTHSTAYIDSTRRTLLVCTHRQEHCLEPLSLLYF